MIGAIVYGVGGFIALLIGLRFVLRLAGANPSSPFVAWVYDWSAPFVAPFVGIFGQDATATGTGTVTTSVIDWSALVALLIIGLIVSVIGRMGTRARA